MGPRAHVTDPFNHGVKHDRIIADEGAALERTPFRARPEARRMSYHVAELARAAGVSPHTVRYYVVRGLLQGEKDPRSGYHRFGERDVLTLAFAFARRRSGSRSARSARSWR